MVSVATSGCTKQDAKPADTKPGDGEGTETPNATAPSTAAPTTVPAAPPENPPAAPAEPTPATGDPVVVTIGGETIRMASAAFSWRANANDMQIMLSDTPDLCGTVSKGALPKNATVLFVSLKLTASDNQDGPFRAGVYPVRTGPRIKPQQTKQAAMVKLDPTCAPAAQVRATGGAVTLTTAEVKLGAPARGSLSLTLKDGNAQGGFDAAYCKALAERPRGCL